MEDINLFTKSLLERARARDALLSKNELTSSPSQEHQKNYYTAANDPTATATTTTMEKGKENENGHTAAAAADYSTAADSPTASTSDSPPAAAPASPLDSPPAAAPASPLVSPLKQLPCSPVVPPPPTLPEVNVRKKRCLKESEISASPLSRKSRLSALAQTINAWEDDVIAAPHPQPQPPHPPHPLSLKKEISVSPLRHFHKNDHVVKRLEEQGFVHTTKHGPLNTTAASSSASKSASSTSMAKKTPASSPCPKIVSQVLKTPTDPTQLSVLERARLFEQPHKLTFFGDHHNPNWRNKQTFNKGATPLKKEATHTPLKIENFATPLKIDTPDTPLKIETVATPLKIENLPTPLKIENVATPLKTETVSTPLIAGTSSPLENPSDITPLELEVDCTPLVAGSCDSKKRLSRSPSGIAESVKRIKVVGALNSSMYPSLHEIEDNSDSSLNTTMSTSSLGSFINTNIEHELNATEAIRQIDDLIDEALEGQTLSDTTFFTSSPLSSSSPINTKLTHTVSVYRKNQQTLLPTATHPIVEEEENELSIDACAPEEDIEDLEQQLVVQERSIAQASKALNICDTTFEFVNSTEYLEGERVLLIACQRRNQLRSYLSSLRMRGVEKELCSPSKSGFSPSTRGEIKMREIQLYATKQKSADYVYHFIVLVKQKEHVFHTNTNAGNQLNFNVDFQIQQLEPDFKINVEVYALRAFKQPNIDHNVKYHIKNVFTPTKKSFLTPQKSKIKGSDLSTPKTGSQIRTPNFVLQGQVTLDLSNFSKGEWPLTLVNSSNLLLPNISIKLDSNTKNQLQYSGFLTLFNDVSGLGAWHRRWATIDHNYKLLFWTYPEQQHTQAPVATIDLSCCITARVSPASREMCARPNTFLLVTTRDPLPSDKESLVLSVHPNYTAIKHLISTDNRSERDNWINFINKALTNMRAWGKH